MLEDILLLLLWLHRLRLLLLLLLFAKWAGDSKDSRAVASSAKHSSFASTSPSPFSAIFFSSSIDTSSCLWGTSSLSLLCRSSYGVGMMKGVVRDSAVDPSRTSCANRCCCYIVDSDLSKLGVYLPITISRLLEDTARREEESAWSYEEDAYWGSEEEAEEEVDDDDDDYLIRLGGVATLYEAERSVDYPIDFSSESLHIDEQGWLFTEVISVVFFFIASCFESKLSTNTLPRTLLLLLIFVSRKLCCVAAAVCCLGGFKALRLFLWIYWVRSDC